jgi:hypothetical protein
MSSGKKPFFRRRLTRIALIIFAFSLFVPWVAMDDFYGHRSYFWSSIVDFHYWNFVVGFDAPRVVYYTYRFFLTDYWFGQFAATYQKIAYWSGSLVGLGTGWFLVFFFQLSTLIYAIALLTKPSLAKRNVSALLIVLFASASLFFGIAQYIVQSTIKFGYFGVNTSFPCLGLWLAAISVPVLLVSFLRSSEASALKIHRKKILGILFLLAVAGFFVFNELQFQTGVTRVLFITKIPQQGEKPASQDQLNAHLNEILFVANVFRARLIQNTPGYIEYVLEVPAVSYRVMSSILHSMGYETS